MLPFDPKEKAKCSLSPRGYPPLAAGRRRYPRVSHPEPAVGVVRRLEARGVGAIDERIAQLSGAERSKLERTLLFSVVAFFFIKSEAGS